MSAAAIFAFFTAIVMGFQLALALGAPWGAVAMGGRFPGKVPTFMRAICGLQIVVLALLATIVLVRARVVLPAWHEVSTKLIWLVVAFSLVAVAANLATPSRWERILWAPVAIVLFISSLVVALS
jgi:hypothetical protein